MSVSSIASKEVIHWVVKKVVTDLNVKYGEGSGSI